MKCTRQSPAIAALAAACCLAAACTEAPADRYIKACVAVATNMMEADSCRCMAPAYARVLTRDEFAALADVAEQGTALQVHAENSYRWRNTCRHTRGAGRTRTPMSRRQVAGA